VGIDRRHLKAQVAAIAAAREIDAFAVDGVPVDKIGDDLADERAKRGPSSIQKDVLCGAMT
jgi:hypothetical protein